MYLSKKILKRKDIKAKEEEAPITTIEIQSSSQSIDELQQKAWNQYFPMGVQSCWIVIPALKGIQVLLAKGKDKEFYFNSGILKDPATGIKLEIEKVFEDFE